MPKIPLPTMLPPRPKRPGEPKRHGPAHHAKEAGIHTRRLDRRADLAVAAAAAG